MIQDKPIGLAHAFILGRDFVGGDRVALILGDNVFYGHGLSAELADAAGREEGATVFAYYVNEPSQYGVVKFDKGGQALGRLAHPTGSIAVCTCSSSVAQLARMSEAVAPRLPHLFHQPRRLGCKYVRGNRPCDSSPSYRSKDNISYEIRWP